MDPRTIQPTLLATGYRGSGFLSGILGKGIRPARVISYRQVGDTSKSFENICDLARSHGIVFEESRRPYLMNDELVFVVGWQFLVSEPLDRCIVFHDLLLPRLRGFSPTVTALLRGDEQIGITAFKPDGGMDTGPIYGSRVVRPERGVCLRMVYDMQTAAMVELAGEILRRANHGELDVIPQEERSATYSVWRDTFDYFIDWRRTAEEIVRHINFVGFPFGGAKAVLDRQLLIIREASLGPDMMFEIRDPGKLWEIQDGRALVICGTGTVWIEAATDVSGDAFRFKNLRRRFLTADNAWITLFVAGSTEN